MARFGVVRFGEFTLKSGRRSPYFVDAGRFRSGLALGGLGKAYAARICAENFRPRVVFGPAYKGIPLSVTTAIALSESLGIDVGYCFDRKEVKTHGEGGRFVGEQPTVDQPVVIVDDVITSGGSIREAVQILRAEAAVRILAVVIAVDRQERGASVDSTLTELQRELSTPVLSIVTIAQVFDHLARVSVQDRILVTTEHRDAFDKYQRDYGVRE